MFQITRAKKPKIGTAKTINEAGDGSKRNNASHPKKRATTRVAMILFFEVDVIENLPNFVHGGVPAFGVGDVLTKVIVIFVIKGNRGESLDLPKQK